MRLITRLRQFFQTESKRDQRLPPLPDTVELISRSFHLRGEGVVTVIDIHQTKLIPGHRELLRVRIEATGERCLVSIPHLLGHGLEVEVPIESRTEEVECEETVERIIGLNVEKDEEEE